MRYQKVILESVGYYLPEEVISSELLENRLQPIYERFGLHTGRLELMSGIRQRRFWPCGVMPSQAAAWAGEQALRHAGLDAQQMDLLLFTSVSRDFLEPASASVVHHILKLPPRAPFHDISNACLGFLNGMITLANMIELGQVKRGLVVAGESSRQLVETTLQHLLHKANLTRQELKSAFASLTIGSGAVAMVLAHESATSVRHRLLGGVARAATEHNHLCQGSGDVGFSPNSTMLMNTDSEILLEKGCELAAQTWPIFKQELGWQNDMIDRCYTHQVGVVHREKLYEITGMDIAKDFSTLEFLGNVGSVSLPITLAMGNEKRMPHAGEKIALLGIGSGLSCMMLGVEW